MNQQQSKVPAWLKTRTSVGVICGLLGLMIGASGSVDEGNDKDADRISALSDKLETLQHNSDKLQAAAVTSVDQETAEAAVADAVEEAVAEAESDAAKAQRQAVKAATAKVRAQERKKADRRVAEVRALTAVPKQATPQQSTPKPPPAPSTDPRFGTCSEANDAGYGPYRRGVDAEYSWYIDRDGDGIVCES